MRLLMATAITMLLLLAACGGGVEDPKQALMDSLQGLEEAEGLTTTFTLVSDLETLQALAEEEGDQLSAEDAESILDSSVTTSSLHAEDSEQAPSQLTLNLAGTEDALELITLDESLFLRANVPAVLEAFGKDPVALQQLAQQSKGSGQNFLEAALQGRWLTIQDGRALAEQLTGQRQPKEPTERQEEMLEQFIDDVEEDAKVTEGDEEGPGQHLIASLEVPQLYGNLVDLSRGLGRAIPPGVFPQRADVPEERIEVDFWVEDGFVNQISFDVLQLAELDDETLPEEATSMTLQIAIEEFTGEIERPEDAVKIDPGAFQGLLPGLQPHGSESASGRGLCKGLQEAPPEVQRQFADECPQLNTR